MTDRHEAIAASETTAAHTLRVAANDNVQSARKIVHAYEAEIRYEYTDRLIEAMGVEQRQRYWRDGIIPCELQYIADEVEAEIANDVQAYREEACNAA